MLGWKSARGRAVLAGVVFVVLLAGMAAVAAWRAHEVQQQYSSLESASVAIASLEHSYAEFAEGQAALAALVFLQDPALADTFRQYAAKVDRGLALTRADALAKGNADRVADLDQLTERIGRFNRQVGLGLPVLLEVGRDEAVRMAMDTRTDAAPQTDVIRADFARLVQEGRNELAIERAAADRALGSTVGLLVAFGAAAFLMGLGVIAMLLASVVRPLTSLRASVGAIASGDLEARAEVSGPEEVASLAQDFNEMVSERKRAEEGLRQARDELEMRVKERTSDLTSANERLQLEVGERRRAEEALRQSEAKYRQIFDNMQDIFYRTDASGIITEISPSVERYGYGREELIGRSVLEVYANPEGRPALMKALLERGELTDYELRLKTGDGRVADASLNIHLLRGPDGTMVGLEGFIRDISERKRAAEALRESQERLRAVVTNAPVIVFSVDREGVFTLSEGKGLEALGLQSGQVVGRSVLDVYGETAGIRENLDRALAGETFTTTVEVAGLTFETQCAPLRDRSGQVSGMIGVATDITERRRAEEALRESEERFRSLSASAPLGILLIDAEGEVVYTNERLQEISGLSPEESLGHGWSRIYPPAERETVLEERSDALDSGRGFSGEFRIVTPQGVTRWVRVRSAPMCPKEGGPSGHVATVEDITERMRAEEALRESEAKYRSIFENVQDIFYRTDAQGIITEISPSVERYGYTREGMIGTQVLDVYEDPEERAALLKAVLEQGEVVDYEIRLKTGDGRVIDTSVSTHVLRGPDGEFAGVEGALREITERKRMEEALRESEAKYRSIFENVQDIFYRTDAKGIITEISPSVERYGYTREGMIGSQVLDVYEDPEERAALLKAVLEQGEVVDHEIRLKTGDGRVIDTSVSTHVLRGPGGEFAGVEGALRDIGERKRMEEALRQQTRRDALTGALNHMAIVDQLRDLMADGGGSHAVAMVDVDGLKATNDTYGHQVGDAVLVAVAGALSGDGALVGRYGGDEFVAILPGADRDAAERYREGVLAALAEANLPDPESGARVPVVVSIGLAIYPTEAGRLEELIKAADSAMYAWRRQRPIGPGGRTLPRPLGSERAATMVGELVPLLTSPGDLDEKLRLVAHRLSVGAGYDAVNVDVYHPVGGPAAARNVFAKVSDDVVETWRAERLPIEDDPFVQLLLRTRRPIIVEDPQNDERLTEAQRGVLRAAELESAIVVPLFWQDEMVGALSAASKRQGAFTSRDAEFLMAVATQVSAMVRSATLVDDLQSASDRLLQAQGETVMLLAAAAEARDHATGLHLQNVRAVTEALAQELGFGQDDAAELGLAAVLHDIGKIRVPDLVLSTAGQLTDEEWGLMRQHTVWGAEFLAGRPGFELAASIARSHHERWDGGGYPDGLSGDDIPEAATIVAVADAFDAMTSDRPYKARRSVAAAVREIVACSGGQFSPRVVQALTELRKRRVLSRLRRQSTDEKAAA